MPSGLTAAIYEDKDVTLRDYLMQVGRQMGFAILQRDDDFGVPVHPVEEESSYYAQSVDRHEARLRELRRMTYPEVAKAAQNAYETAHDGWERTKAEKQALLERYTSMLRQVEAWEPDPLVASTKDHAIKYLRESIAYDVARPGEDPMRYYPEPQRKDPETWLAEEIARDELSLEFDRKHLTEQRERTADRNRHIEAFLRSLPEAGR